MKKIPLTLLLSFLLVFTAKSQTKHLAQIGEVHEIQSIVMGMDRSYYVQLPDNYDPERSVPYPVIYLVDGESLLPALATVHQFYSGGFIPESIMVGINNGVNRTLNLTPSSVDMLFGQPAKDNTGGAPRFLEFIKSELIPHIDQQYNTSDYRTLIGHSYGGLFTLHALLNSPETFANYLAIDPGMDWDNQHLYEEMKGQIDQSKLKGKSLFMSLNGQLNMQDPTVTLDNLMEDQSFATVSARASVRFSNLIKDNAKHGLDFNWKLYPRDLHGTIPLPSMMDGLIALFEWFQMEAVHLFNNFETPVAELDRIIQYRANKLESRFGRVTPPYPADLMYHMSYMCMDMGQFQKAKMFLDHYLQFYPKSAGPYEATAEYYERRKSKKKALEYAEKAYELSGSEHHRKKVDKLKK